MASVFDDIISELISLCGDADYVEEGDMERIKGVIRTFRLQPESLEEDAYNQTALEVAVAWLAAKYEYLESSTEVSAKRYKGEFLARGTFTADKADAQWKSEAKADMDPDYFMRRMRVLEYRRIRDILDRLGRALERRANLANTLLKRDRVFGQSA